VGHSTGLLLVGGIFILKDYLQSRGNTSNEGNDPIDIPDSVGHFFESLVGLFMIALGVYGLRTAFRKQRECLGRMLLDSTENDEIIYETEHRIMAEPEEDEEVVSHESRYRDNDFPGQAGDSSVKTSSFYDYGVLENNQNPLEVDLHHHDHNHNHLWTTTDEATTDGIVQWTRHLSTTTLALLAGIVHGLAGPGGVLGIVPAVQLHNWKLAVCYLGSFCISSTLTMGLFACTYGTVSSFLGNKNNWEFQIQCFSAALSLAVGVTWLVLLSLGKLDDVFP
jgi:hypothetical protein